MYNYYEGLDAQLQGDWHAGIDMKLTATTDKNCASEHENKFSLMELLSAIESHPFLVVIIVAAAHCIEAAQ